MADYAAITGWGKCVPPAILTNDEIASVIDTSDEWIRTRTGVERRHVVEPEQTTSRPMAARCRKPSG